MSYFKFLLVLCLSMSLGSPSFSFLLPDFRSGKEDKGKGLKAKEEEVKEEVTKEVKEKLRKKFDENRDALLKRSSENEPLVNSTIVETIRQAKEIYEVKPNELSKRNRWGLAFDYLKAVAEMLDLPPEKKPISPEKKLEEIKNLRNTGKRVKSLDLFRRGSSLFESKLRPQLYYAGPDVDFFQLLFYVTGDVEDLRQAAIFSEGALLTGNDDQRAAQLYEAVFDIGTYKNNPTYSLEQKISDLQKAKDYGGRPTYFGDIRGMYSYGSSARLYQKLFDCTQDVKYLRSMAKDYPYDSPERGNLYLKAFNKSDNLEDLETATEHMDYFKAAHEYERAFDKTNDLNKKVLYIDTAVKKALASIDQ